MSDRANHAIALLGELSGRPVDPAARLDELGLDSLALAEIASALESGFGVRLDEFEVDGSATVGRVLEAVEAAPDGAAARMPKGTGRLQSTAAAVGGWALRRWFRLGVRGASNVPRIGPVVLAMNHESALDIPLIVLACPRPIVFMAKRELFKNPFVSWSLRALGGFRVDRDRYDLGAVGAALEVLERGGLLGMYPEGTRSPGELLPFLHGAAWVALRTGAPIVPCAIWGTELAARARLPGRVRVAIAFGAPIACGRVEEARERLERAASLTGELRGAIERLLRVGR